MRNLILGALVCVSVVWGSTGQAQTMDPQIMAPINRFLEAFNKGDMAGAAAAHASGMDLVIIDEVPPFLWRGAQAFQAWTADLDADGKKRGVTEPMVTLGEPTRTETDGAGAYVIVPAVYTFKEKGVAMRGVAQMTFILKKGTADWLIHGWTWTGSTPQKDAGSVKKQR